MVSIENLHLSIEGKEILKGIELHLKTGDIYGLIGPVLDAINPFAGALNTFDSVIIDSEPFRVQAGRLLLVAVWLGLCLPVARRSGAHPNFR